MINRAIVFRSALSLVVYLAFAAGTVEAQDPPRTELGIRLAENHGDGAFYRLEEVKLRQTPAYPAGTLYALKTSDAAYRTYIAGLRGVEEEAGVTTMLLNDVLGRTLPGRPEDWPFKAYCEWDVVVLKHYPNWRAWEMVEESAAQHAAVVHRGAAVANEQIVITPAPEVPPTPRQVTNNDPTDRVFYMVNLIQLREEAFYPRGEFPDSTGREAYARYQGGGELSTTDRVRFVSVEVPDALNPTGVSWWRMNIVQYPSLREFMEIELTPEFRHIWRHKDAGLSPICSPATVPTLPESSVGR